MAFCKMSSLSKHYQGTFPRGVFTIFFTNIFVNFTMVTFFALTESFAKEGLHQSTAQATAIGTAYGSLIFGGALIGGILVEKFSLLRLFRLSAILCVLGVALTLIPSIATFHLGLACFIAGFAIFNPGINLFLSHLYRAEDLKRTSGFTISYMGVNIGATLAAFIGGSLAATYGYYAAFLVGSFGCILGYTLFFFKFKQFNYRPDSKLFQSFSYHDTHYLIVFLLFFIAAITLLLSNPNISNILMIAIDGIALLIFLVLAFRQPEPTQRKNMLALVLLITISQGFWLLYMTSPNLLNDFISFHVERHLFGINIPSSSFWGFGTLFIILLGGLYTWMWKKLSDLNKNPSDFSKFAMALILIGVAYACISLNIYQAKFHWQILEMVKISGYWIILSYLLQTCGELLIGPVGFSMIGKLSPTRYEATFMGYWQLAMGIGAAFSGWYSAHLFHNVDLSPVQTYPYYLEGFSTLSSIAIGLGIGVILIRLLLLRLAKVTPLQ